MLWRKPQDKRAWLPAFSPARGRRIGVALLLEPRHVRSAQSPGRGGAGSAEKEGSALRNQAAEMAGHKNREAQEPDRSNAALVREKPMDIYIITMSLHGFSVTLYGWNSFLSLSPCVRFCVRGSAFCRWSYAHPALYVTTAAPGPSSSRTRPAPSASAPGAA